MDKKSKILILGSTGMLGSALVRKFTSEGYDSLLTPTRDKLDLLNQIDVLNYFEKHKPEYIILAAGKVGGLLANIKYPADFMHENLLIQLNVIGAASKLGTLKKLLFIGSSCIFPKECPQPIKEEYLLTGELEPTNEAFAVAKIAGLKLIESFRKQYKLPFFALLPSSMYGPNDNYDTQNSHVIGALLMKFKKAISEGHSTIEIWGTGRPRREFLYVDDMADACLYFLKLDKPLPSLINIGHGEDISIKELALKIKSLTGYNGELTYNSTMPDGVYQKVLDVNLMNSFDWTPKTSLTKGLSILINDLNIKNG